jgi:hypothetical protein
MARVTYVHWDESEAHDVARRLVAGGHEVTVHWAAGEGMQADSVPEVLVVSLERLPSHGRAVAQWLWSAQYRRAIPIVFVGGARDPVERAREQFGDAVFCGEHELAAVVTGLVGSRDPR